MGKAGAWVATGILTVSGGTAGWAIAETLPDEAYFEHRRDEVAEAAAALPDNQSVIVYELDEATLVYAGDFRQGPNERNPKYLLPPARQFKSQHTSAINNLETGVKAVKGVAAPLGAAAGLGMGLMLVLDSGQFVRREDELVPFDALWIEPAPTE